MSLTALVLAGVRPGGDPLAKFAKVSHKALIPIGGVAMLDRVIAALRASGRIGRIAVSIDRPDLVSTEGVEIFQSKASLSDSVADAFSRLGAPLFVTTADHALLEPEWVSYFLDHLPDVSVAAALARSEVVMAATPGTKRTFLKLADGAFSGCNMFYFRDPEAVRAIEMWREVEALRKKPLKLLARLGPRAIATYAAGRLTLARGAAAVGRLAGVSAGAVEMPFGRAAVDVDKPADLVLVRKIVGGALTAYAELSGHFGRIAALSNAIGILQWDNDAMMPRGASATRAESMALLHVMRHDLTTDRRIGDWLAEAETENGLGAWERANIREIRRIFTVETALPADLVAAASKAVSACEMKWRQARAESDFASLLPLLAEVLRLQREIGQAKGEKLGLSAYDALLNDYEPGGRSDRIDALFDDLAAFLPGFLAQVIEVQARRPQGPAPEGPFPIEKQRALGLRMMAALGYDFERGRLDVSTHPFCGGADNDVRITTRYDEADFASALMGVLHETGHALYEQGRPVAFMDQPVGHARSMSLHESQSLLIEMQACRSREFIRFAAPLMREAFGGEGPAWGSEALWRRYTKVAPGFIRVDADEVTYPAHVILRYRLEKALIADAMPLSELPSAWADGMRALLGITPPSDRLGCLQDVHWPSGGWGYFPTYTLGAMTAAQVFDAAKRADPDALPAIARGDFRPLLGWLRENIHGKGSLHTTDELLTLATGRPLDPSVFKAHLRRRYVEEA